MSANQFCIFKQCAVAAAIAGALLLSGCDKQNDSGKGPAEAAGQQIDKAAVVADQKLKEAAEATGKALENAGAKMQEKAKEAQK